MGDDGAGGWALNSWALCLTVNGSDLYMGGYATNVAGINAADFIARWDGTNWSVLGASTGGNGSLYSKVYAIAVSGKNVYAGGSFIYPNNSGVSAPFADYIAGGSSVSGNWSELGNSGILGNGSFNGAVRAIAIIGSDVYAAGFFENVPAPGGVNSEADLVARWKGATWMSLGSDGLGNGSLGGPEDPFVESIALDGPAVYVSGNFWNVNNNGSVLP